MGKRAVIYVRTSSEQQGEKCSPVEQEADCRLYADRQGLVVVNVYRDIERYRVKNKWVEPSGTRYDRPGLLAMLRDAADDQFDVILAWREDRLYRGMRAMLLVLETIQQYKLEVQLAMDKFDPATAPLKAWLAQVELDNIKERMTMGVKARLKAGKANSGQDRYGYKRVGEKIEVVPEEAEWVRQIFAWYIEGIPLLEMRKRLIAANAPQKQATIKRRFPWATTNIQGILKGARDYAYGVKIQRREGESFQIQIDPILDMETYKQFLDIKNKRVFPPTHIPKKDFLIRGLLYCPCSYRMATQISKTSRRHWDGEWKCGEIYGYYLCACRHPELLSPNCPRSVSNRKADQNVWEQVCSAINHPELLMDQARILVEELKDSALSQNADRELIEKELNTLFINRQWVITRARKGAISESEMEQQLSSMSIQEVELKKQLTAIDEAIDMRLLIDWEAKVTQYFVDLQEGIRALNNIPDSPDEQLYACELKRRIVETLVEKINVDRHHQFTVTIRLHILGILDSCIENNGGTASGGGGHWPLTGSGKQSKPSDITSSFQSRNGHIRVSAVWTL
ncbi:MAG: recombinase family protein [Chloroflexota bacterium]